jgi:hypothetical protein
VKGNFLQKTRIDAWLISNKVKCQSTDIMDFNVDISPDHSAITITLEIDCCWTAPTSASDNNRLKIKYLNADKLKTMVVDVKSIVNPNNIIEMNEHLLKFKRELYETVKNGVEMERANRSINKAKLDVKLKIWFSWIKTIRKLWRRKRFLKLKTFVERILDKTKTPDH